MLNDLRPHKDYQRLEKVSTFGLLTAHNPMGVRASDRDNFEANALLLNDIKTLGCQATVLRGMYAGHREEMFCIANIPEVDLLRLAFRHRQEAAIWGFLRVTREGHFFNVYYLDNGEVAEQKTVEVDPADVETKEAFFSAIKSKQLLPHFNVRKNAVAVLSKEQGIDPLPFGDT